MSRLHPSLPMIPARSTASSFELACLHYQPLPEVVRAIADTIAHKAPDHDETANGILEKTREIITPHLRRTNSSLR